MSFFPSFYLSIYLSIISIYLLYLSTSRFSYISIYLSTPHHSSFHHSFIYSTPFIPLSFTHLLHLHSFTLYTTLHYTSRFSLADGTRWDDDIEKLCPSLPPGWCVDLQWYVVGQPCDPDGWFYATSVEAPYWYRSSDDSSFCKCSLVMCWR